MNFLKTVFAVAVLFSHSSWANLTPAEENDASDRWTSAFAWLQTGKNLAALEQWPLAAASFSESLKQFASVVEKYPEYEADILAYRMEKLKEMIAETDQKLTASDHEISMLYADAIEMIEKGETQRFQIEDFGEAFKTMTEAQNLIEEVIEKRPTEFATAMKSQVDRIQSNLDWLTFQLGYANRPKSTYVASSYGGGGNPRMSGTTEFVKAADLPAFSEDEEKDLFEISNALFPSLAKAKSAIKTAPAKSDAPPPPAENPSPPTPVTPAP